MTKDKGQNLKSKAVFIDRDGTISKEVGYVNHVSRYEVFDYSAEAIKLLNESEFLAILTTNQAGVARGYFVENLIGEVHQKLQAELGKCGAKLDAIYYCPHHPSVGEPPYRQDCNCRKPKPGMILQAVEEFGIDLSESWMIGDRYSDVVFGHKLGLKTAFLLSGYGRGEWEYQRDSWKIEPDLVGENLLAATKQILQIKSSNS